MIDPMLAASPTTTLMGCRGDQYVRVVVETPANLTKRQKEILQEFGELESKTAGKQNDNYPRIHSFLEKFKEWFG